MTDQQKSPEEIEREIAATRSEIDETIDALQEKVSPGQLVDQALGYVKEGGGDFAANLGRAVRDNPMPLMLIGVGLGWMMFSGRSSEERSYERVDADGSVTSYRYDPHSRSFYAESGGYAGSMGEAERRRATTYGSAYDAGGGTSRTADYGGTTGYGSTSGETGYSGSGGGTGSSQSAMDRAKGAASDAKEGLADAGGKISQKAGALRHEASERMRNARHAAGEATHAAGERISGAAAATQEQLHRAREQAGIYAGRARHQGARARRTTEQWMYDYPLAVGAVALAVGAGIAAAIPATRREHEVLGESSDAMKAQARHLVDEQIEQGREVGSAALEAGRKEAEAQHLTPGEIKRSAEDTLKHAAEGAASVAKTAARTAEAETKKRAGESGSGTGSSSGRSTTSGQGASGKTPT